jgi:hypothetical protein
MNESRASGEMEPVAASRDPKLHLTLSAHGIRDAPMMRLIHFAEGRANHVALLALYRL